MSIAVFKKITLFGLSQDKSRILEQLQELGCVHLKSINPEKPKSLTPPSTSLIDQLKTALNYLKDSTLQGRQKLFVPEFNADKTVADILRNQNDLREAMDRRDFLEKRIKELSVWGNFNLSSLKEIGNIRLWFYKIKRRDISLISPDLITQEIYRDNLFVYLVVLSEQAPPDEALPAPRSHTGAIPLNHLRRELDEILEKIDDLNETRHHLTRYRLLLTQELARFVDRTALQQANEKMYDLNTFFLLQGWIPEKKISQLKEFCDRHELGITIESASPEEIPPTLMETYPWASAGVELVKFYQTPNYYALDPSLLVFFSFSLFFAMILADAGYALIIALFTIFAWKRLGKYNASTWLKPLLISISIFSIAYGVIVGSYFGISPSPTSFLGKFKFLDINDFKTMMRLVIVIGCLHIMIANGIRAWFETNLYARLHSLGFMLLIFGFMLMAWGFTSHQPMITQISILLVAISMMILIIFASDLPVTDFKSFFKRVLSGLAAVTQLSSLFGDVLSYLRLFALGLAGASLAVTFNQIAEKIATQSTHGRGWVLAFLVLILGQTLNFLLCLMSAVIHGLRLNYIEFFKWSIKEEGYVYEPLKKMEVPHE